MKLVKLLVAVLTVSCMAIGSAVASDQSLPRNANRVERAVIKAMIDPPGSFAVMYRGEGIAGQCPINPGWTVTVTLRPDIDGTYIQSVCPRTGPTPCECDIFVRTVDTKQAWEAVLARYRADYRYTLPVDPSPRARVESRDITYIVGERTTLMDPSARVPTDVTRGDEFQITVNAFVPAGSESPCSDPKGRPCYLTTELWQLLPDGSRKMLMTSFEIGDWGKAVLQPGSQPTQVSLRGIVPHPTSYRAVPKGKAILIAKWFLNKNYSSLFDHQIPVGGFEVPLDIR